MDYPTSATKTVNHLGIAKWFISKEVNNNLLLSPTIIMYEKKTSKSSTATSSRLRSSKTLVAATWRQLGIHRWWWKHFISWDLLTENHFQHWTSFCVWKTQHSMYTFQEYFTIGSLKTLTQEKDNSNGSPKSIDHVQPIKKASKRYRPNSSLLLQLVCIAANERCTRISVCKGYTSYLKDTFCSNWHTFTFQLPY